MGKTSNHYNAFYSWKENLLSGEELSQQSSFPRRLKDAFYAGEGIKLILGRKIPMPSYEQVSRLRIFEKHPIYTLLGEDKFTIYYKKNPNYLWELFTFGPDILFAVEKYGLTIDLVEGFFSLDYQGRPQLKDILRGDEERLYKLYESIHTKGISAFIDERSGKDFIRRDLIGTINPSTSNYYDDKEFEQLLEELYVPGVRDLVVQ